MSDHAWLICTTLPPGRWALSGQRFLIGREPPCDLIVALPGISRQHASIERRAQAYFVTDLGSRNGTFCNGQAVGLAPLRLTHNDTLVIGAALGLQFADPAATAQTPRLGRIQGIWIDEANAAVWVDGQLVEPPLSAAQLALLRLLYARAGQLVSREQIIAAVWPGTNPTGISGEAVDGLIKRLRAHLRRARPSHNYISVLRGFGLRLDQPAD